MASTATRHYHARLHRALRHIDAHLDDDLSLDRLSAVAAFSKFHFHRQFAALFGIGVFKYVQRVRLKRASERLAYHGQIPILDVALDSGYDGPEAFARAFKRLVGQTPSDFRKQPDWDAWHGAFGPLTEMRSQHMEFSVRRDDVRIVDFPETPVAVLEHRGDPALLGDSIRRFIAWRKATGLSPTVSATFNILYDNPETTPPAAFRLDLCAGLRGGAASPDGAIVAKTIPAGRCAMLRHVGAEEGLKAALTALYADWLPQSGEELRDFPLFLQRVALYPFVAEQDAVTDIFLPLTTPS